MRKLFNKESQVLLISPGFHCNVGLPQYDHFKPTKIYVVHVYLAFKIIGKLFTFSTLSRRDSQKLIFVKRWDSQGNFDKY